MVFPACRLSRSLFNLIWHFRQESCFEGNLTEFRFALRFFPSEQFACFGQTRSKSSFVFLTPANAEGARFSWLHH